MARRKELDGDDTGRAGTGGAKRIIAEALALEVAEYIELCKHLKDEAGRSLVVRNGCGRVRKITIGSGTVEISAPRVNDRREGIKFISAILPPYMRRSPKVAELLPLLYLKGLSTGDVNEALSSFLGEDAAGLSQRALPGSRAYGLMSAVCLKSAISPTKDYCLHEMELFEKEYGAKYPKAVECLLKDKDSLTTHFKFPGEHWVHIRSTNPIESTCATVKLRTRVTKGAGSREASLAMAFKLLESAEKRWRRIRAPHLVARVREGIVFKDGIESTKLEGRVVA